MSELLIVLAGSHHQYRHWKNQGLFDKYDERYFPDPMMLMGLSRKTKYMIVGTFFDRSDADEFMFRIRQFERVKVNDE